MAGAQPGRLSPRRRPAAQLGFSGVAVETSAIFYLEASLAINSDTLGHNQGQRKPAQRLYQPLSGGTCCCVGGGLFRKKMISPERCTKF